MASVIGNRAGQKFGNYQLKQLVGRGSFAEVYLAEHIYLKTQVAVKVLHTQLAKEDQESFLNEARTLARLKHPSILSILEFGIENGMPFLVMDYASRGSLRDRFPRRGHPTPVTVLPFIKQAAAALQYAHQEHIVHRDVKPENMLLDEQGELLLSDFGMSVGAQSSRTQDMEDIAGTIAYMAPEQIRGLPIPASDQYALGIVLYEWLSGTLPFSGTFSEIASQQVMAAPPPIKAPAVSPEVEAVIQRALAKSPEERFPGIQSFADAFEQATLEVGGTFRAPTGWMPHGIYQQLQTVPSIEKSPTLREKLSPSTEKVLTQWSETSGIAPKKAERRLPRGVMIGMLALALLVAVSGIAYLIVGAVQPGSPSQGKSSVQTGVSATAWQDRYTQITSQKPFFTDSLSQNTNGWDSGVAPSHGCLFTNGSYHVSSSAPYSEGYCGTKKFAHLDNVAYQVQMTILRGNEGGILFRFAPPASTHTLQAYWFSLNRNGTYNLWAVHTYFKTLLHGSSAVIKQGLNQPNLLTVIAKDKQIALYINGRYANSIIDDSADSGLIGMFAQSLPDTTEVAYSNLALFSVS